MSEPAGTINLLRFLTKLLSWHADLPPAGQSQASPLTVVPCISDNLPNEITALTSIVHAAGGVVVNTSKIRAANENEGAPGLYNGPVPGEPKSSLVSLLKAALSFYRITDKVWVEVTHTKAAGVDARYGPKSVDAGDSRSDPVLAVARALCSDRLCSFEFVVLIYDETELDIEQRQVLWRLARELNQTTIGRVRTLVLLAIGTVEMPRHVEELGGFRYAISGERLLVRNAHSSLVADVQAVARSSAPFVGFFLGAGFSASSGLPLGNKLRDTAIKNILGAVETAGLSSGQLAEKFYGWATDKQRLLDSEKVQNRAALNGGLTLERVIREEARMIPGENPPTLREFSKECLRALDSIGGAPRSLAHMIRQGRRMVICTVNFDELLETAASDLCRVFATDDDFLRAPAHLKAYLKGEDPLVPLWKLHGTIGNLSSCVANDAETLLGLSQSKTEAMIALFEAAGEQAPFIYLGASMRDIDLNPVWARPDCASAFNESWVMPLAADTVDQFINGHRAEKWRQEGRRDRTERIVTETADTYLARLNERWGSAVSG